MPWLLLIGVTPAALRESDQRPPLFECGTGRCAKQPRDSLGRDVAFRFVDDSPLEGSGFEPPVPHAPDAFDASSCLRAKREMRVQRQRDQGEGPPE